MNGKTLPKGNKNGYTIADGKLRIANAPDEITLEIETLVEPEKNTSMMGLFVSNAISLPNARRRFPQDHLVPRSPGRDGEIHGDAARRQEKISGIAVQWQPDRTG